MTKVKMDINGKNLGYGFVQYKNSNDADLAIEKVNGMQINLLKLHVCKFQPLKYRKSVLEKLYEEKKLLSLKEIKSKSVSSLNRYKNIYLISCINFSIMKKW